MARKTVMVCDSCGKEVDEKESAVLNLNFNDARKASRQADFCEACANKIPGRSVTRRGRKPKMAVTAG